MNNWIVSGFVGNDVETRQAGQNMVATFSLASSQGKDKPTTWIRCQVWSDNKWAYERALAVCKGDLVQVAGPAENREYKSGDEKRTSLEIRVRELDMLQKPTRSENAGQVSGQQGQGQKNQQGQKEGTKHGSGTTGNYDQQSSIPDADDVPF